MIPRAIELFSGCGGLSTGILDAGVQVVSAFDHNEPSITGFRYNHGYRGAEGHVADLAVANSAELFTKAGLSGHIDLLAGGPPCQPFSIAGKRLGLEDRRGNLIFRFNDLVAEIRPTAFIFENVPNLIRIEGGSLIERMDEELRSLGYDVHHRLLNAADFGVAQARRRFVMVGVPKGVRFAFPEPTHGDDSDLFGERKPYVTVSEALGDLPDVTARRARTIPNHEPTMHTDAMVEAFRNLVPGTRDKKSFHDRLHADRLGYTLRAGSGNFSPLRPVHYKYDRVITVRESARLQGMSDSFIWPDPLPRLQQYRQVGNAVPPPLGAAVTSAISHSLGWSTDSEALKGDPGTRPKAFFLTHEERHQLRVERIRGASLGRKDG